jgi:hypothetical protein
LKVRFDLPDNEGHDAVFRTRISGGDSVLVSGLGSVSAAGSVSRSGLADVFMVISFVG